MLHTSLQRNVFGLVTTAVCIILLTCPAKGESQSDSALFYLSHSTATPGEPETIVLSISCLYDIGGFNFIFGHENEAFDVSGFTLSGTRSEGIQIFAADVIQFAPGIVTGLVTYNPFYPPVPAGDGPMIKIIVNTNPWIRKGSLAPLLFFDEQGGRRNEVSDPSGLVVFTPEYDHGSIFFPIDSLPEVDLLTAGDVNLNSTAWEIADYVSILNRILGITSDQDYPMEDLQSRVSDANRDLMPWTIADIRVFEDVTSGYWLPPQNLPVRSVVHLPSDSVWFEGFDGTPVDTLFIPVYFSNSFYAGAVSMKFCYPTSALHFVSHSTEGSRIPLSWESFPGNETESGFAFVAMPAIPAGPYSDSIAPGAGLLVTLKFAVLLPSETTIPLWFERLQTRGQVNAYATSDGQPMWNIVSLQQIDGSVRFSFIRGDASGSGFIDIDDIVFLIQHVFAGGPAPGVYETGDFNNDFLIDVDDIVSHIDFIFG